MDLGIFGRFSKMMTAFWKSVKICNILIRLEETLKPFSVKKNHNICLRIPFCLRNFLPGVKENDKLKTI